MNKLYNPTISKQPKIKKTTIALIIMAILLLLAGGYIFVDKYGGYQIEKGIQIGYEQMIIQIMQQASTCQQVPLTFYNQTINLIAIECLQNGNG